jgi:hypothetical protein
MLYEQQKQVLNQGINACRINPVVNTMEQGGNDISKFINKYEGMLGVSKSWLDGAFQ